MYLSVGASPRFWKEVLFLHYLDHAATTPVPKEVAEEMLRVLLEEFGNPSSQYEIGRRARDLVAQCRKTVASALGCPPEQLHFTSCGTEADNWAIQASLWHNRHVGKHVITTAVEHSAVLEPCRWLEQQGYEVTRLAPDKNGVITAEQVAQALRPDTALVSMLLVNNELGTRYPIEEVAALLRERKSKALLHTDAVQAFLKVSFTAASLGADLISISAHKIGGPKGVGALYIGPRLRNPKPLLAGGAQEGGLRSGTEATAQIAGFAKAVELRRQNLDEKLSHMAELKAYAIEQLRTIPDLELIGRSDAPHILAVSLVGWPSQNIVNDLNTSGICVSAGSACHQGKPSHVFAALKLPKKTASGVIRISFGPETEREDVDACVEALRRHHDTRMPML